MAKKTKVSDVLAIAVDADLMSGATAAEILDDNIGNRIEEPMPVVEEVMVHVSKGPKKFEKTAHLFAHRKAGTQKRFEKVYKDLKDKVQTAWLTDLEKIESEHRHLFKFNQALAATKTDRSKQQAAQIAKSTMRTVFDEWRAEIDRIVVELGGHPQEDGNVLFPDGSVARMPKGLFIAAEHQLRF